jgi:hypothetical protein
MAFDSVTPMTIYRYVRSGLGRNLEEVPASPSIAAVAAANGLIGIEAFRAVPFDALPADVIQQLRRDGTRGELRDLDGAREVFDHNVPAEAKASVEGVQAVTNDPTIDWMHQEPHAAGGGTEASNGVYGPEGLNQRIGDQPMTAAEVQQSQIHTRGVAEQATPGVTGDVGEVIGDTLEIGAWGGVLGSGVAVAHRWAQAQGYRDQGRADLAAAAQEQMLDDAAKGAVNGVVRGGAVAITQAVLGANPLTAGIGLVAPDAVMLLSQKDQLTPEQYNQKAASVVGKGALATALVCAGPVGWIGLAGLSVASAYNKAASQAGGSGSGAAAVA